MFSRRKLWAYIHQLREEIAWLKGQLRQSEDKAEKMARIAEQAIDAAKEAVKPDPILRTAPYISTPKYVPQTVAYCPSCNVSVRHPPDAFPVKCPACTTLIDPFFDDQIID